MSSTARDEPEKVVLVPESLYDDVCAFVDHLERGGVEPVDKPALSDGIVGERGREPADSRRFGRRPRGWVRR